MIFNSLWKKRTGELRANSSRRRMATSIKKKIKSQLLADLEVSSGLQGLAGPQSNPNFTLHQVKTLWHIVWSCICLCGGGTQTKTTTILTGPRCFPHDLHSALHISYPHLASFTCKDTYSLALHNGALVPAAALKHRCNHSNREEEELHLLIQLIL